MIKYIRGIYMNHQSIAEDFCSKQRNKDNFYFVIKEIEILFKEF